MGLVLAFFTQAGSIVRVMNPVSLHASQHAILGGFSSHIFTIYIGLSIPWLIRASLVEFSGDFRAYVDLVQVGLAIIAVIIIFAAAIFKSNLVQGFRNTSFTSTEGKLFIASFMIVVVTYVSSKFILA